MKRRGVGGGEERRRKRGIRWRKDAVSLMRSAAVNVMHPLVPPKKWSIVPKLPALFSCYQCSKMCSHVEMRGIGGGEEKERSKFGGEMMQFCWKRINRGECDERV